MFKEDEDWNDEQDAQVLSNTVAKTPQKGNSSTGTQSKVVGKKSLLRTLQTLGAVPEWKNNGHQQDSDSETETAPSHSKKKKKRKKKRKHAEREEEQQQNGNQSVKEEKPVAKKRKKENTFGGPKAKNTCAGETMDKEMTKSVKVEVNKTESTEQRLSRQQWKNKMKNKRKCKNKFSQNKPEEEVNKVECANKQGQKEELKPHSYGKNNKSENIPEKAAQKKKKEKECKPQKKKMTKEDSDTQKQPQREEKQQIDREKRTKSGQVEKCATKSSADGSNQNAVEPVVEIKDDQQRLALKRRKPELSKEQSQKREKLRKMLHTQRTDRQESPMEQKDEPAAPENEGTQDRSASLRSRMEQRLESARFRYINEVLYSTDSGEARSMFRQDPQAFWIYHRGYTAQVQRWPANPVDAIISYIQQKPSTLVVADFGCGDCKIARSVKNKVHSFDLAAACELVTVCDMASVPLNDKSVDIAVFCLSLMGTNLTDFISEANRVLKIGGVLKIAEVASRFDNVRGFITTLATLGFKMVSKDTENTHFYAFEFVKTGNSPENVKTFGLQLKPCVYKKR
ncbi:Ribosomal RNA-processing protein 8 [Channa argus]|uniref:Ribosomal RNA-processing protein 8 n=1 Tax=Channa argus TaxID=215402 RepID=A0A6G1PSG9_CHAAH|nr:Ribosomal RNA-processing protein 8 [Channa argus]KAK2912879.1 hypothetical protein Q8A73_006992 [Channa argus]